ncbi:23S rRNA 2'-O-ribose G2251 methyltransferase [Candidatus Tremblaya phenacola PAVE]|nr:23S rRNA 2'-O-ribose G2251 methyltransferase [Candidatus Tremblaya phenacola PAVE]
MLGRLVILGVFFLGCKEFILGSHPIQSSQSSEPSAFWKLGLNAGKKGGGSSDIAASRLSNSKTIRLKGLLVGCEGEATPISYNLMASHLLLVLDGVTDITNIGSCLRVAESAGVDAVMLRPHLPAERGLRRIIWRASSGASQLVPLVHSPNLRNTIRALKGAGHTIIGSDHEAPSLFYDVPLRFPLTIIVGSEEKGVAGSIKKECHVLTRIPMWGTISSLNVAVASSVMLFEIRRRLLF